MRMPCECKLNNSPIQTLGTAKGFVKPIHILHSILKAYIFERYVESLESRLEKMDKLLKKVRFFPQSAFSN